MPFKKSKPIITVPRNSCFAFLLLIGSSFFSELLVSNVMQAQESFYLPTHHQGAPKAWIKNTGALLEQHGIQPAPYNHLKEIFHWKDDSKNQSSNLKTLLTESERETFQLASSGKMDEAELNATFALQSAEPKLDTLNRDPYTAQIIYKLCLNRVWSVITTKGKEAAKKQWPQCNRFAPQIKTSFDRYPSEVKSFFEELSKTQSNGNFSIRVVSKPEKCKVYINGKTFGSTPFHKKAFFDGKHFIRIDCPNQLKSQLHLVEIKEKDITLRVDVGFESTISTHKKDGLTLSYPDLLQEKHRRFEDALKIGAISGANQMMIMSKDFQRPNHLRFDLLEIGEQRISASAIVEEDLLKRKATSIVQEMLHALKKRESVLFQSHAKTYISKWQPPATSLNSQVPKPQKPKQISQKQHEPIQRTLYDLEIGISLVTLGAASWISAWALWGELQNQNQTYASKLPSSNNFLAQQKTLDQFEQASLALGIVGSLSLSSSWFFLLPEEEAIPWWAWTGGGAGLVLFAWSFVPFAINDYQPWLRYECIDPACTRKTQTHSLGGLTMSLSLPLLSLPATYLLRNWMDERFISFELQPTPNSIQARLTTRIDL